MYNIFTCRHCLSTTFAYSIHIGSLIGKGRQIRPMMVKRLTWFNIHNFRNLLYLMLVELILVA